MKINIRDYSDIFLTSDWHVFHNKAFLYEPRGCTSPEEHTEMLINGINKQADENALILNMGDQALTCTFEDYVDFLNRINCKNIWSIIGNHDNRFIKLLSELQRYEDYLDDTKPHIDSICVYDGVIELYETKDIRSLGKLEELVIQEPSNEIGKKDRKYHTTLCHYPLINWNKSHHGTWNLCGHAHATLNESSINNTNAKRLDVGVDNSLKYSGNIMFDFNEVRDIMRHKKIEKLDHHNEKTT